jgi:hypothetical protein
MHASQNAVIGGVQLLNALFFVALLLYLIPAARIGQFSRTPAASGVLGKLHP